MPQQFINIKTIFTEKSKFVPEVLELNVTEDEDGDNDPEIKFG